MPDLNTFYQYAPYHILSYGTLLGTSVFQSFINGVVGFKVLPRAQFATLQIALTPIYFAMQTALPVLMALTFPGSSTSRGRTAAGISGVFHEKHRWNVLIPLATMFIGGAVNWMFIGPATTKVMRERKHQETRDGKRSHDPGPHSPEMQRLNKQFNIMHSASATINLVALGFCMWYSGTIAELL